MAMITLPNLSFSHILTISIFLSSILHQATAESDDVLVDVDDLDAKPMKTHNKALFRKQKLSHFRFYWHDIVSGPKPTSMSITKPAAPTSKTFFGMVNMIDNPLTRGPDLASKALGKAQGFYASASQEETAILMAMNLVFNGGKYNGSTITILGRNDVFNEVREMPVIGGSGLFRFARGYAQARTHSFNISSGDAVVKYDVYVMHY